MALGLFSKKVSLQGWKLDDQLSADAIDLPCPWCSSKTAALDTECPSCAHPFG